MRLLCAVSVVLLATCALTGQERSNPAPNSQVPTRSLNEDAEIMAGSTNWLVQGQWELNGSAKETLDAAVVVECDKTWTDKGECLWIEASVNKDGKPHIGVLDFSIITWTDEEVLAERAGIGDMCYNEVLLIRLGTSYKNKFPSKGSTTLTRTPKAGRTESTRNACEKFFSMKPEVYRVVRSSYQH